MLKTLKSKNVCVHQTHQDNFAFATVHINKKSCNLILKYDWQFTIIGGKPMKAKVKWLILRVVPWKSRPFSAWTAFCAAVSVSYSTKQNLALLSTSKQQTKKQELCLSLFNWAYINNAHLWMLLQWRTSTLINYIGKNCSSFMLSNVA